MSDAIKEAAAYADRVIELCISADRLRETRLENLRKVQAEIHDLRRRIRMKWDSFMSIVECVDRTCAEDIEYFISSEAPYRCLLRDMLQDLSRAKETRDALEAKLRGPNQQQSERQER